MSLKYVPALDGLRGYAVLAVILFHCDIIYWGWLGVQLFFTLSGFLITLSLLSTQNQDLKEYLKGFYLRRAFRIFPLYFAFLLLIVLLHFLFQENRVSEDWLYLSTYTYNIFRASDGFAYSNLYSHLWSLSVEEQFYIVWPFVVYFLISKHFAKMMVSLLLVYAAIKILMLFGVQLGYVEYDFAVNQLYFQTFFQADAFIFGALVAYLHANKKELNYRLCLSGLVCIMLFAFLIELMETESVVAALRLMSAPSMFDSQYAYGFGYTMVGLMAIFAISIAINPAASPVKDYLLKNRFMVYTGKISYGLYIFHYPIIHLAENAFSPSSSLSRMALYVVCIGLAYLVSALSYTHFESRFLALKSKYT